jgi:CRP/FNR family transcriptional regulator
MHTMAQSLSIVLSVEMANGSSAVARISDSLSLLAEQLNPKRRVVHVGDVIYRAGEHFCNLYILNSGLCKIVNLAPDGREHLAGLSFRGDWMGCDGIADGRYNVDAIAMDTGEIWVVSYQSLLDASQACPAVLQALHVAMSQAIARDRDSLMSVCTLPAIARVADFLRHWSNAQAERGIRSDQITLRVTRAEIGSHLGMTLESVSRALSSLARDHVIDFATQGRRDVLIPDAGALSSFVERHVSPPPSVMH